MKVVRRCHAVFTEGPVEAVAQQTVTALDVLSRGLTEMIVAADAPGALPAADGGLRNHPITHLQVPLDVAAERRHGPAPFVSLDEGVVGRPEGTHVPGQDVQVRPADSAHLHPDQNVVGLIIGQGDLLHPYVVRVVRDGGFHRFGKGSQRDFLQLGGLDPAAIDSQVHSIVT